MMSREELNAQLCRPEPLILDGGLATQLEAMGIKLHESLWSAGLLHSNPLAIRDAHKAFLDAGSEVLITASYQASRAGFSSIGVDAQEADGLLRRSVELAREAIFQHPRNALVAASVGPWGATCHDGSEYTGHYRIDPQALQDFHRERIEVLDTAGADLLACETMPNAMELGVLEPLLRRTQTPAWVSFCCRDGHSLSDGSPVRAAAERFKDHPGVLALGINCTAPQFLDSLIPIIRDAAPDKPLLVYPNSGESYEASSNRWSGTATPVEVAEAARRWVALGARGVGGCCRMGPEHIRAMAESVTHR